MQCRLDSGFSSLCRVSGKLSRVYTPRTVFIMWSVVYSPGVNPSSKYFQGRKSFGLKVNVLDSKMAKNNVRMDFVYRNGGQWGGWSTKKGKHCHCLYKKNSYQSSQLKCLFYLNFYPVFSTYGKPKWHTQNHIQKIKKIIKSQLKQLQYSLKNHSTFKTVLKKLQDTSAAADTNADL